jgi:hypothetical protein
MAVAVGGPCVATATVAVTQSDPSIAVTEPDGRTMKEML